MFEVETSRESLKALARALADEADGKQLKRDLSKNLRRAVEPAKEAAVAAVLSMPSHGVPHTEPLRMAVARQVKVSARLSGRLPGARVVAKKKGMPRGFTNAPKRLNSSKGFRHRLWGRDAWVHQIGKPGWFDDSLQAGKPAYRVAVLAAMQDSADRISKKAG